MTKELGVEFTVFVENISHLNVLSNKTFLKLFFFVKRNTLQTIDWIETGTVASIFSIAWLNVAAAIRTTAYEWRIKQNAWKTLVWALIIFPSAS